MELTYVEIVDILDVDYFGESTIGYTIPPTIYEIIGIYVILKSLLPNKVKLKVTIAVIRLRSKLTTNKTIRFTEKSFFHTILGFTQSHLGPLGDIDGFSQKNLGTYKTE